MDKYLRNTEDTMMDTENDQDDTQFDDRLESQRETIRQSLDDIANDIGMAMRDVGLKFSVYITVRNSGDSLATIATPSDESDVDWSRASAIVRQVIGKRIGSDRLCERDLPCAVANSPPMNAAEVTADCAGVAPLSVQYGRQPTTFPGGS
jgi:hypothetical protein